MADGATSLMSPIGPLNDGPVSRLPIIVCASDKASLAILQEALGPVAGSDSQFRLGGVAEMCERLQALQSPISTLIVDVSGESDPLAALEGLAMYVEPGVRVFVIGESTDVGFYRRVTRGLGVQDYLYKPLSRDIVARTFAPSIAGVAEAPPIRTGKVVTVSGVRGGLGTTTIAVNLAMLLAERARHHTLLMDADLHAGTAALMLSNAPSGGLRAALENPSRVDVLFAERSSPAVNDRLSLLAAEEQLDAVINPPEGAARHLVELLCNRYNFVLIDLPRHITPLTRELREMAHIRVLVMDPTLASIRDALRHLAVPRGPRQVSRPVVVLNRAGVPGGLEIKQVVDGLSNSVDVIIPWLPKQLQRAATLGTPAVAQKNAFHKAIIKLADEIVPMRPVSAQRRGVFGLFGAAKGKKKS